MLTILELIRLEVKEAPSSVVCNEYKDLFVTLMTIAIQVDAVGQVAVNIAPPVGIANCCHWIPSSVDIANGKGPTPEATQTL